MLTRIYNGEDGQAYFEDLNVPAGELETISLQPEANMTFRNSPDGSFSNWHNGPRLQYVIVLSGQMEIGIGDGTKRMFNPGDILQVEDLTGQGHTTRSVGNRITASVPLAG
jgi:quercetin dioxygenase-like cupin family protein